MVCGLIKRKNTNGLFFLFLFIFIFIFWFKKIIRLYSGVLLYWKILHQWLIKPQVCCKHGFIKPQSTP